MPTLITVSTREPASISSPLNSNFSLELLPEAMHSPRTITFSLLLIEGLTTRYDLGVRRRDGYDSY